MDVLFHFTNKLSHTACLKGTAVMTARGALFPIFYLKTALGQYQIQTPTFIFFLILGSDLDKLHDIVRQFSLIYEENIIGVIVKAGW